MPIVLVFGDRDGKTEVSLSTKMIPGQMGLHNEIMSQKTREEVGENLVDKSTYCVTIKS